MMRISESPAMATLRPLKHCMICCGPSLFRRHAAGYHVWSTQKPLFHDSIRIYGVQMGRALRYAKKPGVMDPEPLPPPPLPGGGGGVGGAKPVTKVRSTTV